MRLDVMGARKEIAKRRTVFRCFVVSVAALCVVLLVMQARERALTSFAREHEKENREWAKRWVPQDDLDDQYPSDAKWPTVAPAFRGACPTCVARCLCTDGY